MPKPRSAALQGREFTLVFRTFGADVAEVMDEMNAFATGQHPCYPEARHSLPPGTPCTVQNIALLLHLAANSSVRGWWLHLTWMTGPVFQVVVSRCTVLLTLWDTLCMAKGPNRCQDCKGGCVFSSC